MTVDQDAVGTPNPNKLPCAYHGAACPPDERVFIDPHDLEGVIDQFFGE